jgi:hypothetical protein
LDHGVSNCFLGLIDDNVIRTMKAKSTRKRHSSAFNAKVGLEALMGIRAVAQIAREHSVHPVQVS